MRLKALGVSAACAPVLWLASACGGDSDAHSRGPSTGRGGDAGSAGRGGTAGRGGNAGRGGAGGANDGGVPNANAGEGGRDDGGAAGNDPGTGASGGGAGVSGRSGRGGDGSAGDTNAGEGGADAGGAPATAGASGTAGAGGTAGSGGSAGSGGQGGDVCRANGTLVIAGEYVDGDGNALWIREGRGTATLSLVPAGPPRRTNLPDLWRIERACSAGQTMVLEDAAARFRRADWLARSTALFLCISAADAATATAALALSAAATEQPQSAGCNGGAWLRFASEGI